MRCGCSEVRRGGRERLEQLEGPGGAPAVDTATNQVFVDTGTGVEEFPAFAEPGSVVEVLPPGGLPAPGGIGSQGLAVSDVGDTPGSGTVFASEYLEDRVAVMQFVERPDVVTGAATAQTGTTVVLGGTVDPLGIEEVDSCVFEYATSEEYEPSETYTHTVACEQSPAEIGDGSVPVAVSAKLEGLEENKLYHYRLSAGNSRFGAEVGEDETFGAPAVSSEEAVEVGATGARLAAQVNPEGTATRYEFEYGTSDAYGSHTAQQSAGAGRAPAGVTGEVSGLQPETTYHFALQAENVSGETVGRDVVFTTLAAPRRAGGGGGAARWPGL